MTKMAAMPIYGKNPSKIIFSETNRLISRKLGVRHQWLKYSNVYINHDPVMTLTKFMARSTWVACASELGKLLKCHLKEKANRKLANGQNIEDSEKRKWPKGLSAPALELNTIIFKHVYWYMQLISGERLQDHWSSGSVFTHGKNMHGGKTVKFKGMDSEPHKMPYVFVKNHHKFIPGTRECISCLLRKVFIFKVGKPSLFPASE